MELTFNIDKLSIDNITELENRNNNFRIIILRKIYDISYKDEMFRYIINNTKFKDMLLIRFQYCLSKLYYDIGIGDMVFYDKINNLLYVLELKSLKDKYTGTPVNIEIENCIAKSLKYSEYTIYWASKESIAVSVIELLDGKIQITERITLPADSPPALTPVPKGYPWVNTFQKKVLDEINEDKWFSNAGDQTLTKYKINGDTLESERIVDYHPSSNSRKTFKRRVQRVCKESTHCTKYLVILKNIEGVILMQEYYDVNETDAYD